MRQKMKYWLLLGLLGSVFFGLSIWSWVKPATDYSNTERRHLAQMPELTWESLRTENSFMEQFESYATDQFPLREEFRGLNALVNHYALQQNVMNDIYFEDGYAAKLDYELDQESIDWALRCFSGIAQRYLSDSKVYFAVVPDKSYYFTGSPSLEYDVLFSAMREGTAAYAEYIDLTGLLSLEDYYRTDSHWKQEALPAVADAILQTMGAEETAAFTQYSVRDDFYGVYAGQSALPLEGEALCYLSNEVLEELRVSTLDSGRAEPMALYDMEKAMGRDGYEMYLGGALALVTIENPNAERQRELVVFRDSFGSSLTPLLCGGYSKVTVVDIRYLSPAFLGNWIEFEGADVLFLYSTSVLNSSKSQLLQ